MGYEPEQKKEVAKTMAEIIHYALAWDEPLNGDDIDLICNTLKKELMELNGEV